MLHMFVGHTRPARAATLAASWVPGGVASHTLRASNAAAMADLHATEAARAASTAAAAFSAFAAARTDAASARSA